MTLLYSQLISSRQKKFFKELGCFSNVSGLRCNKDKTECLRLGKSNMDHEEGTDIKWVENITITGVTFSKEGVDIEKNMKPVIDKLENQLR